MQLTVTVLQPLQIITEQLLKASVPLLTDVIVHYDMLNEEYGHITSDSTLPLYLHHTTDHTQVVLNWHYSKIDESLLYQLALFLHPSMCIHYLKTAKWEQEWINTAIKLTKEVWHAHYKPSHLKPKQAESSSYTPSFGFSLHMDCVLSSTNNTPTMLVSPVHEFVNGTPVFNHAGTKHTVLS
ncbi:hypothetical protein FRC10_000973 [Ceratobasidium sp. 414]|nr:hypothetical protein FRC10_000973 [Ceratobasidium sp. 414]